MSDIGPHCTRNMPSFESMTGYFHADSLEAVTVEQFKADRRRKMCFEKRMQKQLQSENRKQLALDTSQHSTPADPSLPIPQQIVTPPILGSSFAPETLPFLANLSSNSDELIPVQLVEENTLYSLVQAGYFEPPALLSSPIYSQPLLTDSSQYFNSYNQDYYQSGEFDLAQYIYIPELKDLAPTPAAALPEPETQEQVPMASDDFSYLAKDMEPVMQPIIFPLPSPPALDTAVNEGIGTPVQSVVNQTDLIDCQLPAEEHGLYSSLQ